MAVTVGFWLSRFFWIGMEITVLVNNSKVLGIRISIWEINVVLYYPINLYSFFCVYELKRVHWCLTTEYA